MVRFTIFANACISASDAGRSPLRFGQRTSAKLRFGVQLWMLISRRDVPACELRFYEERKLGRVPIVLAFPRQSETQRAGSFKR